MPNIFFIILISFFTLCISFVSVKGTLSDLKYKKKWWKIITKRGWIAIVFTFFVIMLLVLQNYLSEKINYKKDEALRKEKEKSDSIVTNRIKAGVDSNRQILFGDISKAFAQQGLILDTLKKEIKRLPDTSKMFTVFNDDVVINLEIPEYGIKLVYLENDTFDFEISVFSLGASSTNFAIKTYTVCSYNNGLNEYIGEMHFFPKGSHIFQNNALKENYTFAFNQKINHANIVLKSLYLYLKGNYSDLKGKKYFHIDKLFKFIIEKRYTETVFNPEEKKRILTLIPFSK
ncbi:MAG: hypothetical protein ABI666_05360 [Ferruginibacter sp.]